MTVVRQVCGAAERAQLGYIGREAVADDGVALTYVVCSLPELECLDVRKRVRSNPQRDLTPPQDPWKPACRATLAEVARAVRVRCRWCAIQRFLYDDAPHGFPPGAPSGSPPGPPPGAPPRQPGYGLL